MECCFCGHWLPDDSKFCQYCGKRIELPQKSGSELANSPTDNQPKDNPVKQEIIPEYEALPFHFEPQFQGNLPIILQCVSLKKESGTEQVVLSCGFKSLSPRSITAMQVDVLCYNIWQEPVGRLSGNSTYDYSDLHVTRDDVFGGDRLIPLPDSATRSVDVQVRRIAFDDGTIMERDGDSVPVLTQEKLINVFDNNHTLVDEYRAKTNNKARYAPHKTNHYWFCTCGAVNHQEEERCHMCGLAANDAFSAFSRDALLLSIKAKQEKETEERRIQEEKEAEKRRLLREKEEQERQRLAEKKEQDNKRATIVFLIMTGVAAFLSLFFFIIKPASTYQKATQMLTEREYKEAYNLFSSLGKYRDSTELAWEALYQEASGLLREGQYKEAGDYFATLDNYKDSAELAQKAYYSYVTELVDLGKLHEAYEAYTGKLPNDREAQKLAFEAEYQYAVDCFEAELYEDAAAAFGNVREYEDSSKKETESLYMWAEQEFANGSYEKAHEVFAQIDGYKDSNRQSQEAYYQYGIELLNREEYLPAQSVFEALDNYRDSRTQLREAKYHYAVALLTEKQYESAVPVFEELGRYKDSYNQWLTAMYAYVTEHYNNKDQTTYEYLLALKKNGFKDSAQLYKDLYTWTIKLVSVTTSDRDYTTLLRSVDRNTDFLRFVFKLNGGPPGESITLSHTVFWPNGGIVRENWYWENMHRGDTCVCQWDNGPYSDSSTAWAGILTVKVYNKTTGEYLGEGSVKLT